MSRDQRPGKAVMVDPGLNRRETKPVAAIDGAAGVGSELASASASAPPPAGTALAGPRLLLPSIVFLLACVIGACAVALVPAGMLW